MNDLLKFKGKVMGKNAIIRMPADMKLHEQLCQQGGLHDANQQFCFRCPMTNGEKKIIFEVVIIEADETLAEIAKRHFLFVEDLMFINNNTVSISDSIFVENKNKNNESSKVKNLKIYTVAQQNPTFNSNEHEVSFDG